MATAGTTGRADLGARPPLTVVLAADLVLAHAALRSPPTSRSRPAAARTPPTWCSRTPPTWCVISRPAAALAAEPVLALAAEPVLALAAEPVLALAARPASAASAAEHKHLLAEPSRSAVPARSVAHRR